ncbi:MAG: dCTP deaminase domain-containing protein [Candidatus Hodarchaeales archaeon]|jgi:dUTP pyrophosphatase
MDFINIRPAVWPGSEMQKCIPQGDIQPNGIDISIGRLFQLTGIVRLISEKKLRQYPELNELKPLDSFWDLDSGSYLVEVAEEIVIPNNAIGFVAPRSTLLRMGATVFSGIWDKGFQGIGDNHGRILLQTSLPFQIHVSVAIAQMIFISAVDDETVYQGNYQPTSNST